MTTKIGIIGSGNVGSALHRGLSKAGYEARMSNKQNVSEVASGADIIILAVPYGHLQEVQRKCGHHDNAQIHN